MMRFSHAFVIVGLVLAVLLGRIYVPLASASTNISSSTAEHWAWNDIAGWLNFYSTGDVNVNSQQLQGNASGTATGYLSLDCATAPGGNICGTSNYKVLNDGGGWYSGWAWNDAYGWFSFCGRTPTGTTAGDCPTSTVNYQVKSVQSSSRSEFKSGYAWNDILGWVTFNCADTPGGCGVSNFRVVADWFPTSTQGTLDSVVLDSGIASGMQLNSVLIQGSIPSGARVSFQFAMSASSSGPWNFVGYDGTSNSVYDISAPNVSVPLNPALHYGYRYFKYRIILTSDITQHLTPVVDDISINWSP